MSPSPRFFSSLESVRFVCAVGVALFHTTWVSHFSFLPVHKNLWILVDFFFVLSGFVIFNAYGDMKNSAGASISFIVKRIFRLYPLHFATLVAVGAIQFISWQYLNKENPFSGDNWVYLAGLNLLMSHAIGFGDRPILNAPSWSISTEFYAYLIFLASCLLASKRFCRICILAASTLLAFLVMLIFQHEAGLQLPVTSALARCVYSFGIGVVTFGFFSKFNDDLWSPQKSTIVVVCCTVISLALMAYCEPHSGLLFVIPFFFAVNIYALAKDPGSWLRKGLEARWLLYLGKRS